jgi:nitrogen fixation protein FixH
MSKTAGQEFRYYVPTPEEAQEERMRHENEKSLKASEVEKRFLHPALQADKLFTVMVHKEQEQLAKEILSAYPWFNRVKAVREVST